MTLPFVPDRKMKKIIILIFFAWVLNCFQARESPMDEILTVGKLSAPGREHDTLIHYYQKRGRPYVVAFGEHSDDDQKNYLFWGAMKNE